MFRAIETVYRTNKALLAVRPIPYPSQHLAKPNRSTLNNLSFFHPQQKLNEIGPNPASPKALGDLLMRWIGDLEPAYTRYSTTYRTGFDYFQPVQSNQKLLPILHSLPWPSTLPPPNPPTPTESTAHSSLDLLFSLPNHRLLYYKKLYSRLLKSTQEGRSDHPLLVSANERLDILIVLCEGAAARSVLPSPTATVGYETNGERSSGESTQPDSFGSQSERNSEATTSGTSTGSATMSGNVGPQPRIEDLEQRLDTDRALDIFTMQPKKCKLQIAPANLPFVRQLRRASPVHISFVPLSDPSRRLISIPRAYIILLTDLFLICERMTDAERIARGRGGGEGPDMWLLYPPLAGKHLRVRDGKGVGEVEVTVMKKEVLTVRTGSREEAEEWRKAFEEAIAFGNTQGLTIRTQSQSSRSTTDSPTNSSPSNGSPSAGTYRSSNGPISPSSLSSPGLSSSFASLVLSPDIRGHDLPPPSPNGLAGSASSLPPPTPPPREDRSWELERDRAAPPPPPPSREQQWEQPARSFSNPTAPLPPTPNVGPPPPRKASMPPMGAMSNEGYGRPPSGPPRSSSAHRELASPSPSGGEGYDNSRRGSEPQNQYYNGQQAQSQYPPQPPTPGGPPQQYQQPPPQQGYNQPPPSQQPQYNGLPSTGAHYPNGNGNGNGYPQQSQNGYPSQQYSQGRQSPGGRNTPSPNPPNAPFRADFMSKSSSSRSHASYSSDRTDQSSAYPDPPPLPGKSFYGAVPTSRRTDPGDSGGLLTPGGSIHRSKSAEGLNGNHYRMPSQALGAQDRASSAPGSVQDYADDSPPPSPRLPTGPTTTTIAEQMRCKAFLQQHHAQWKSLGTAKLKLFVTQPTGTKQLVVESDKNDKKIFISTIILSDGVERVGKTGVAIELSDQGQRTGMIYMLQLKTEATATGLFDALIKGSDRASNRTSARSKR
ncbi:hypothetical protein P7C70_g3984, partial [Phenoliferia sp. Uapishka_3]